MLTTYNCRDCGNTYDLAYLDCPLCKYVKLVEGSLRSILRLPSGEMAQKLSLDRLERFKHDNDL